MQYTIQLDTVSGVISVIATGNWQFEVDTLMAREIMQKVDESGLRKVLLDIRELQFDLSMAHIFNRANILRNQRMEQGVVSSKVALVYAAGNKKLDSDMRFFETTAQNRAVPYRVFTDMQAAKAWILQD
jgi:hypothetical protein